ncbi:MAG: hypothetical protein INR67_13015, partial [Jatrophihabitans endophyticus]|nr:hypothetical protein [Jatrophihabitans endophyticus]
MRPQRGLPAGLTVPAAELIERFSRSSGPGGQSVNTTDSRVELRWDVASSRALTEPQRERLLVALAGRLVGGVITVAASEHRSQLLNRTAARARLANYLRVITMEAQTMARACGKAHVLHLEPEDLVAVTVEAAAMAGVPLA